jgi:glucose uptake protein GlcU
MRRWLLLTLAVTLSSVSLHAYSYLAFEQITVANTAIGFTASKITGAAFGQATIAICTLRTAEISYTFDGTTPTTTIGMLWQIGESKQFNGHDVLVLFRAIRTGGTSGQLDCSFAAN